MYPRFYHCIRIGKSISKSKLPKKNHGSQYSTFLASRPSCALSIAIKDNIVTKDLPTTASSKILTDYVSPIDATVVSLLGKAVYGKTNLDEFGMGSHSRNTFKPVESHLTRDGQPLSAGGSSGGSAVAVATSQCWAALGTDTGGSVRLPASYTGIVGFKPSYGRISRWGVIDYANSLDTVGILTRSIQHADDLFEKLDQYDRHDPTSLSKATRARIDDQVAAVDRTTLRIGVPLSWITNSLCPTVRKTWITVLGALQTKGHTLIPFLDNTIRQALSAYYMIAPAEASSNLAKFDGVRYGLDVHGTGPLFCQTRDAFGPEVKRRILLGAYTLSSAAKDNHFIKAQKVRRLVQKSFDDTFAMTNPLHDRATSGTVDVIIAPTAPTLPPTIAQLGRQSIVEGYMNDILTVPASLAGLPAVSVPVDLCDTMKRYDQVSTTGLQVIGQFGDDKMVLKVGREIEENNE